MPDALLHEPEKKATDSIQSNLSDSGGISLLMLLYSTRIINHLTHISNCFFEMS